MYRPRAFHQWKYSLYQSSTASPVHNITISFPDRSVICRWIDGRRGSRMLWCQQTLLRCQQFPGRLRQFLHYLVESRISMSTIHDQLRLSGLLTTIFCGNCWFLNSHPDGTILIYDPYSFVIRWRKPLWLEHGQLTEESSADSIVSNELTRLSFENLVRNKRNLLN